MPCYGHVWSLQNCLNAGLLIFFGVDTENGIKNQYISVCPFPDPVLEMLVHLKIAKDLEKYSSLHTSQEIPR